MAHEHECSRLADYNEIGIGSRFPESDVHVVRNKFREVQGQKQRTQSVTEEPSRAKEN